MTGSADREPGEYASPLCFLHELQSEYRPDAARQMPAEVKCWRKTERERLIAARLALSADTRAEHARTIAEKLDALLGDVDRRTIALYWPFRGEPDLRGWAETVRARGGHIALPVVVALALTLLIATGGLIALGTLDPMPVLAGSVTGAFSGAAVSYWLGHRYRERITTMWPLSRSRRMISRGRLFFRRHGAKGLLLARFTKPLRPVMPAVPARAPLGCALPSALYPLSPPPSCGMAVVARGPDQRKRSESLRIGCRRQYVSAEAGITWISLVKGPSFD
jgi:hypothetical protein